MTRSRIILALAALSAAAVVGCAATDTTSPAASTPRQTASFAAAGDYHDGHVVPGSVGNAGSAPANGLQNRLACNVTAPITGTATIGPEGGELRVGGNLLIVPAGALTKPVTLSGTIAPGSSIVIDFQPHGLQFKKPAGLILDLSACGNAPDVVYLDEQGGILERITAVFSNWWHTVAAPLDHFSSYALDV